VSPNQNIDDNLSVAYAYATSTTSVLIRISNATGATKSIAGGTKFYITIFEF
jgi:hypothetical protein